MLELSIVLPTCNRAELLEQTLDTLRSGISCSHEIIVVDGASTDGTQDVLKAAQKRLGGMLRIIREPKREGFVRATNKGFRAARGRCLTWINDDARPMAGALDRAIAQLDKEPDDVAFVAMFHRWHSPWNVAYQGEYAKRPYQLCHVRGTLYANFPMGLRSTYERLGYFDERFYVCGADPDLSLKAWYAGFCIVPAWESAIDHEETEDERRVADSTRARSDNEMLFAKWDLPPRGSHETEFDPTRPCTLRRLREQLALSAA